jgi:hypothetical protein
LDSLGPAMANTSAALTAASHARVGVQMLFMMASVLQAVFHVGAHYTTSAL